MIKSFLEFINEEMDQKQEFIKDLTLKLLPKIKSFRSSQDSEYSSFSGMEFDSPYSFVLNLEIKKTAIPDFVKDSHFKNLPWEKLNYDRLGYSIDANTTINQKDNIIPEIKIHLLIDPGKEPLLYSKLYARLLDILTHETNHLEQMGKNETPFNANPSLPDTRESAKRNYRYFLLPDEIESMVEGFKVSAEEQELPLDQVFSEYLMPFVISKYITKDQYNKVISTWIKYAIERYPNIAFSNKAKNIIDSL